MDSLSTVELENPGPNVHKDAQINSTETNVSNRLIIIELEVEGLPRALRALVDTGASNNFVRYDVAKPLLHNDDRFPINGKLIVKLANGTTLSVPKCEVTLSLRLNDLTGKDSFLLLDLDDRFDLILGMPWLTRHKPQIDWDSQSLTFPHGEVINFDAQASTGLEDIVNVTVIEDRDNGPACDGPDAPIVTEKSTSPMRLFNRFDSLSESEEEDSNESDLSIAKVVRFADGIDIIPGKTICQKVKKPRKRSLPPRRTLPLPGAQVERVNVLINDQNRLATYSVQVENPPSSVEELTAPPVWHYRTFLKELKRDSIEQICWVSSIEDVMSTSTMDETVLDDKTKKERFESQTWEALRTNPVHDLLLEYRDVFPDEVPSELPKDRGIRHEIDLVPGTKYCVTRQWPLPKEQVEAIDSFFAARYAAGQVRESKSPHSSPTFCVKKATGGWRIVHAFNKLNDATIPAQTPIPRKDMIIDSMSGSEIFSTIDLMDGFYQILMRDKDIPLTAVSTPSGMLWEWLVMPQGLKNAPATFNRMVLHILRPLRDFAPSYFDDVFIHSKGQDGLTAIEMHRTHLRALFDKMREHKLYANLKKCIFAAPEIPVLGCIVGREGTRPDPEKVKSIVEWPIPNNVKELRQFLGLSNYLHKYARNYADVVRPLTQLLRNDSPWEWTEERAKSFQLVKGNLQKAPILALPDHTKTFHVVCDASQFAIGCALMQFDDNGHERVISYQSRQLKPAERNYPVHDKELLAMKYALVKFRVHLMGQERFAIYTDHASLRTATKSPHLSQRMARWLSFFSEYNFVVHYKPGKNNILADALSRRPDYDSSAPADSSSDECHTCHSSLSAISTQVVSPLPERIKAAYATDPECSTLLKYFEKPLASSLAKLSPHLRAQIKRFSCVDGLLYYTIDAGETPRIVVPLDDSLRTQILFEYHDSPLSGHLGREKTFLSLSRDFYWPHMYKWVRKYVRTCETCQRVKPSPVSQAPLHSLAIPADIWKSVSMDFVFGLPNDKGCTGILVFVDRLSKMVHLVPVSENVTAEETAQHFIEHVFRLHGMPLEVVSDRDPRFTSVFWRTVFSLLGTRLAMSTAAHPQTDGQTERYNRVIEDILRSYATSFVSWSNFLPLVEFSLNNASHASTGHSPFFVNSARNPRLPTLLTGSVPTLSEGDTPAPTPVRLPKSSSSSSSEPLAPLRRSNRLSKAMVNTVDSNFYQLPSLKDPPKRIQDAVSEFTLKTQCILRFIRDRVAISVDKQKEYADRHGRKNKNIFTLGQLVLLSTKDLPKDALPNMQSTKLVPRFIGPFKIVRCLGDAYTLDIPTKMRLHPTFYVGRLKEYFPSRPPSLDHSVIQPGPSPELLEDQYPGGYPPTTSFETGSPVSDVQNHGGHPPTSSLKTGSPVEDRRPASPGLAYDLRGQIGLSQQLSDELTGSQSSPSLQRDSSESQVVDHLNDPSSCLHDDSHERSDQRGSSLVHPGHEGYPSLDNTEESLCSPDNHTKCRDNSIPVFSDDRPGPPPLIDSHGDERWVVEAIVDHRPHGGEFPALLDKSLKSRQRHKDRTFHSRHSSREFRVRWVGYPPEMDSWIPRRVLWEDIPDILTHYESQHGLSTLK